MLQVGKELNLEDNQKLKNILLKNMDVFAWKHEDMVEIESKVSCFHLNVNLKFTPHR